MLVAYEIIYYLRQKRNGKRGFMSLKLDMSKGYDRVDWNYLEKVLMVLGLQPSLINLIMNCVKLTSFYALINGIPKYFIKLGKELRQGDPIFPYLFLMCTEGLVELFCLAAINKSV